MTSFWAAFWLNLLNVICDSPADLPDDVAMRLRKTAVAMMRAMENAAKAIDRLKAKPVPVHEPDGATGDGATGDGAAAADTDGVERAIASLLPLERKPMDDAFVRERIALARKIIMEERGIDGDFPVEDDPFSAEGIRATLRANQQGR